MIGRVCVASVLIVALSLPAVVAAQETPPSAPSCGFCRPLDRPDIPCAGYVMGSCCCLRLPRARVVTNGIQHQVTPDDVLPSGFRYWLVEYKRERTPPPGDIRLTPLDKQSSSTAACVQVLVVEPAAGVPPSDDADRAAISDFLRRLAAPGTAVDKHRRTIYIATERRCRRSQPAQCPDCGDEARTYLVELNRLSSELQQVAQQRAESDKQRAEVDRKLAQAEQAGKAAVLAARTDLEGQLKAQSEALAAANEKTAAALDQHQACSNDLKGCEKRLAPPWSKWAARSVAVVATLWSIVEAVRLSQASAAYDDAPVGAPHLGALHEDVVAARWRLAAAGATAVVGWAWTLSLEW
jgi:hypothetical protein